MWMNLLFKNAIFMSSSMPPVSLSVHNNNIYYVHLPLLQVSSVHWSVTRQEQLVLSSSWDGTVRLWDPQAGSCLTVFTDHTAMVYSACWSPHLPHTFASVSGKLVQSGTTTSSIIIVSFSVDYGNTIDHKI